MTVLRRPAGGVPVLVLLANAIVASGCGATSPSTPTASPPASSPAVPGTTASTGPSAAATSQAPGVTATAGEPSLTPVPGAPSSAASAAPTPVATTTVPGFGAILDAVPASFPRLVGQEPADPGTEPTSGTFAVQLTAEAASGAIRTGLEQRGWKVDVGSPLEDGTVVLDATGPTTDCKAEVRFTPQGATLVVAVLYGAACPAT